MQSVTFLLDKRCTYYPRQIPQASSLSSRARDALDAVRASTTTTVAVLTSPRVLATVREMFISFPSKIFNFGLIRLLLNQKLVFVLKVCSGVLFHRKCHTPL